MIDKIKYLMQRFGVSVVYSPIGEHRLEIVDDKLYANDILFQYLSEGEQLAIFFAIEIDIRTNNLTKAEAYNVNVNQLRHDRHPDTCDDDCCNKSNILFCYTDKMKCPYGGMEQYFIPGHMIFSDDDKYSVVVPGFSTIDEAQALIDSIAETAMELSRELDNREYGARANHVVFNPHCIKIVVE